MPSCRLFLTVFVLVVLAHSSIARKTFWDEYTGCRANSCANVQDLLPNVDDTVMSQYCPIGDDNCLTVLSNYLTFFKNNQDCLQFQNDAKIFMDQSVLISTLSRENWRKCYYAIDSSNLLSGQPDIFKTFFKSYFYNCEDACVQMDQAPEEPPNKFTTIQGQLDQYYTLGCADLLSTCQQDTACSQALSSSLECYNGTDNQNQQCKKSLAVYQGLDPSEEYPFGLYACIKVCTVSNDGTSDFNNYNNYMKCVYDSQKSTQTVVNYLSGDDVFNCLANKCITDYKDCQKDNDQCVKDFSDNYDCTGQIPNCKSFQTDFQVAYQYSGDLTQVSTTYWSDCFDNCGLRQSQVFNDYFLSCKDSCVRTADYQKNFALGQYKNVELCRKNKCQKQAESCDKDPTCQSLRYNLGICTTNKKRGVCLQSEQDKENDQSYYSWSTNVCEKTCMPSQYDKKTLFGAWLTCYYDYCSNATANDTQPDQVEWQDIETVEYSDFEFTSCLQINVPACPPQGNDPENPNSYYDPKCSDDLDLFNQALQNNSYAKQCDQELQILLTHYQDVSQPDDAKNFRYPKSCQLKYLQVSVVFQANQSISSKVQLVAQVASTCATFGDISLSGKQIQASVDQYNGCLDTCGTCPYGDLQCERALFQVGQCITDPQHKQCAIAMGLYDLAGSDDDYPYTMYTCSQSCVSPDSSFGINEQYKKIESCRVKCQNFRANTNLSYSGVKRCKQIFCSDSFYQGDEAQLYADKLDSEIRKYCERQCKNLWGNTDGQTQLSGACQICALRQLSLTSDQNEIFNVAVRRCYEQCLTIGDYVDHDKINATKGSSLACQKQNCEKLDCWTVGSNQVCTAQYQGSQQCQSNNLQGKVHCKLATQRYSEIPDEGKYPYSLESCRAACQPQTPDSAYQLYLDCAAECNRNSFTDPQKPLREQYPYKLVKDCIQQSVIEPDATNQPNTKQLYDELISCAKDGQIMDYRAISPSKITIDECTECIKQRAQDEQSGKELNYLTSCKLCAVKCAEIAGYSKLADSSISLFATYVSAPYVSCQNQYTFQPNISLYPTIDEAENCKKQKTPVPCQQDTTCQLQLQTYKNCVEDSAQNTQCNNAGLILTQSILYSSEKLYPWQRVYCQMSCRNETAADNSLISQYIDREIACESISNDTKDDQIQWQDIETVDYSYYEFTDCLDYNSPACPPKGDDPLKNNSYYDPKCNDDLNLFNQALQNDEHAKQCDLELKVMKAHFWPQDDSKDFKYPQSCSQKYESVSSVFQANPNISSKVQLVAKVTSTCATYGDISLSGRQIQASVDEYNSCLDTCGTCPYGDLQCEKAQFQAAQCMSDFKHIQCAYAGSIYETTAGDDDYPYMLYTCSQSCVSPDSSFGINKNYKKIESCRAQCYNFSANTNLSYSGVKRCQQIFCSDSFYPGDKAQKDADKLDSEIRKYCERQCKNLWTRGDGQTQLSIACQKCALRQISLTSDQNEIFNVTVRRCYEQCLTIGDYIDHDKIKATKGSSLACQNQTCEKLVCWRDGSNAACIAQYEGSQQCLYANSSDHCQAARQHYKEIPDEGKYPYSLESCRAGCQPQNPDPNYKLYLNCTAQCNRNNFTDLSKPLREQYPEKLVKDCIQKSVIMPDATNQPNTKKLYDELMSCAKDGQIMDYKQQSTSKITIDECTECIKQRAQDEQSGKELNYLTSCKLCAVKCAEIAGYANEANQSISLFTAYVAIPYSICQKQFTFEPDTSQYPTIDDAENCKTYQNATLCDLTCQLKKDDYLKCQGNQNKDSQCNNAGLILTQSKDYSSKKQYPWQQVYCQMSCRNETAADDSQISQFIDREIACETTRWKQLEQYDFTFQQVLDCINYTAPFPGSQRDRDEYSKFTKCRENTTSDYEDCQFCAYVKVIKNKNKDFLKEKFFYKCERCFAQCLSRTNFESEYIREIIQACSTNGFVPSQTQKNIVNIKTTLKDSAKCIKDQCMDCSDDSCTSEMKTRLQCEANNSTKICDQSGIDKGQQGDNGQVPFSAVMCLDACRPLNLNSTYGLHYTCEKRCTVNGNSSYPVPPARKDFTYADAQACIEQYCYKPLPEDDFYKLYIDFQQQIINYNNQYCVNCSLEFFNIDSSTKNMLTECQNCFAQAVETISAKQTDQDVKLKFEQYIGGCQSECVTYAELQVKDFKLTTVNGYNVCLAYKRIGNQYDDRDPDPDWKKYRYCTQSLQTCRIANKVFADAGPDDTIDYSLYLCHLYCQQSINNSPIVIKNTRAENDCITRVYNGLTFQAKHTCAVLSQCFNTYVPNCNKYDGTCITLEQQFQACTLNGSGLEDQDDLEACSTCNKTCYINSNFQQVPLDCLTCYRACQQILDAGTSRSPVFDQHIVPNSLQCVQYGEVRKLPVVIRASIESASNCEATQCRTQYRGCQDAEDQIGCNQQLEDFQQCTEEAEPGTQCRLAYDNYRQLLTTAAYPYTLYACRLSCLRPEPQIDSNIRSLKQCSTACLAVPGSDGQPLPDPVDPDVDPDVDPAIDFALIQPDYKPIPAGDAEQYDEEQSAGKLAFWTVILVLLQALIM